MLPRSDWPRILQSIKNHALRWMPVSLRRETLWLALLLGMVGAIVAPDAMASTHGARQNAGGELIYADGLKLTKQAPRTYVLTWDAYEIDPCEARVTYDIYRGDSEDFEPSARTLVAQGLNRRSFVSHEPDNNDHFYLVVVNLVPTSCSVHSGTVEVFPLDLGDRYSVSAGTLVDTCTAQSTTEIWCPSIKQTFHAVIAEQFNHEYLIGCEDVDFNGGAWNCVDLRTGFYSVVVHSNTLTVLNGGWVEANTKTGKTITTIVPVFSILARLH